MGYGGPEFAKNKDKLSKECKLQRDAPLPPVDQKGFNEDGDCVPEGNVLQQIKVLALLRFHAVADPDQGYQGLSTSQIFNLK